VHGYEWARFRFDARRRSVLDGVLTAWLRLWLGPGVDRYRARYGDVHERNVLFELRPPGSTGCAAGGPGRDGAAAARTGGAAPGGPALNLPPGHGVLLDDDLQASREVVHVGGEFVSPGQGAPPS
jgi:hypothetical protein